MAKTMNAESAKQARTGKNGPPPELVRDRYAQFVKLKKDEEAEQQRWKSAQGATRSHLKACKKDGINPAHFTELYAESKLDPAQVALDHAAKEQIREFLNLQIKTGDLFPDTLKGGAAQPGMSADALDKHYSAGLNACEKGKTQDSHGLPVGSPEEIAFTKGWNAKFKENTSGGNYSAPTDWKALTREEDEAAFEAVGDEANPENAKPENGKAEKAKGAKGKAAKAPAASGAGEAAPLH